jgi:DUF1680 family protein
MVSFSTVTNFLQDGNVVINVDETAGAAYNIDFRVPYWSKDFSIAINGKQQRIGNTEAISIKRVWKKGDKISIHFNMPTIVLDGGKSYPGQVAFQRGPQVLAFDKSINGFNADAIYIDSKNINLQQSTTALPAKWIGTETFQLNAKENSAEKDIILVPYADASQTGGAISTWIKKENK